MKFKRLEIKNFRNFKEIDIKLSNNNIIFGMNDTGKTNFLYALRYMFDYKIRNKGFKKSDFHQHDTNEKIEIILEIDISEINSEKRDLDTELLITRVFGSRLNNNTNDIYIKLESIYDEKEAFGNIILYWGSIKEELYEIPSYGQRSELDNTFNVIYMSPNIDLEKYYKQNKRFLISTDDFTESDEEKKQKIDKNVDDLNKNISKLEIVKELQESLTEAYKRYRNEPMSIEIKSEISINGPLNELIPYIKWDLDDKHYYPTSGEGRRKLLSYALNHIVSEKRNENKISVYLIEEPENSLHRSMQIGLSEQLFNDDLYKYFFLTTHSPEILYEMDNTQLIRINNRNKQNALSTTYNVPVDFRDMKKQLNKGLANSIFYDKILLVEGGSEHTLFETLLSYVSPKYELNGNYLLQVDGISFKEYIKLYKSLGIEWLVKTDNDLKKNSAKDNINKYDTIGINRGLDLIDEKKLEPISITEINTSTTDKEKKDILLKAKKNLYDENEDIIEQLKNEGIYIPKIELEYELSDILLDIQKSEDTLLANIQNELDIDNLTSFLQSSKLINMISFCKNINKERAEEIFNKWDVLKEFVEDE